VTTVDPITLGVIWGALQSITVEVGTTVHRTAHSQQAREGQDFSVCLFDPAGRMVAQGPYSPGHMGAMSFAAKNALAAFPGGELGPGDVVLFNSPFLGSGHFPDFFMIQPAFHTDGRLIGFAANILHHTDVGGMRPGSQAVEGVSDFFQEGLHVPPVKLWRAAEEQEGILAIILANTRMPDSMLGDLRAQRSSLRVGELRLGDLCERHGYETVQAAMVEIMTRTEAKVREAIRAIPDGAYPFEDFMDDCGPGTDPMRLFVTVTVRGDEVLIDFDGTGRETESGMNSYLNYTRSYCYAAVKCLTDPAIHSKASDRFEYGDVVSFQQPGAGGYGPPWERDPRAVLRDVAEDYVSLEGARRDYGVVIDPVTMTVDETATRAARAAVDRPDPPPIVTRLDPLW